MLSGFTDILFFGPRTARVKRLPWYIQLPLYLAAAAFVALPIIWFAVTECMRFHVWIPFALAALVIHALAKLMFSFSKHIQHRFSQIKNRRFFMKIWLIVEYVLFMWMVYLFYPLACILIPSLLWLMGIERFLGLEFLYGLLMRHPEQFVTFGSVASYILFILGDGYKKIKAGFLPDYLGLYAVLTVMSGAMERAAVWLFRYIPFDSGAFLTAISQIFTMSNDSMSLVASVMTLFFAIYSLYKTCGVEGEEDTDKNEADEGGRA